MTMNWSLNVKSWHERRSWNMVRKWCDVLSLIFKVSVRESCIEWSHHPSLVRSIIDFDMWCWWNHGLTAIVENKMLSRGFFPLQQAPITVRPCTARTFYTNPWFQKWLEEAVIFSWVILWGAAHRTKKTVRTTCLHPRTARRHVTRTSKQRTRLTK